MLGDDVDAANPPITSPPQKVSWTAVPFTLKVFALKMHTGIEARGDEMAPLSLIEQEGPVILSP